MKTQTRKEKATHREEHGVTPVPAGEEQVVLVSAALRSRVTDKHQHAALKNTHIHTKHYD